MERPEKFSLHWSDFDLNLRSSLASLRIGGHFSDVTLVTEDGQAVKAHRAILSTSSPLFDKMLKLEDHPKPIIFLRGTNMNVLDSLVDFIYHGEVEVLGDHVDAFLALANDLKVKGLSKEASFTKKSFKMTNIKCATPKKVGVSYSATEEDTPQTIVKEEFQDDVGLKPALADIGSEIGSLYNCNWCATTSISLKGLEKHKYRKHSSEKQEEPRVLVSPKSIEEMFPCSLCEKLSVSKAGLQKHKIRHHHDV